MTSFEKQYPKLAAWIRDYDGWIEIGCDEMSASLVRVFNPGGMVWESQEDYALIDEALAEAEQAVAKELASY